MVYVNINLFLIIRTFYVKVIKKNELTKCYREILNRLLNAHNEYYISTRIQGYKAEGIYDNS